jgi:hypothetical protein
MTKTKIKLGKHGLFLIGLSIITFSLLCKEASCATPVKVGATTPFTTIEGENGTLGGGATIRKLQSLPPNAMSSPELEASGRAFVQLAATGQSVSWINPVDSCNTINIRECITDAPAGGGIDETLDLYVNGTLRMAVPLSSKQTWVYEGTNGNNNGMSQDPATGGPHVFYDESRTMITGAALHKGDTVMLKKDAANTASFYYIDCVDFESAAIKPRPANSLSVTDYGVNGADATNCNTAFNNCCNAAKSQGKTVWIPAGKYYLTNWSPNGVTIAGAGMWYTTLYFTMGQIQATSCNLSDFCVDAVTVQRDQGMGGVNIQGSNWTIDRLWAIHGCWAGFWCCGTNGTLQNSRSSTCWGDGLNMNNGSAGNNVGTNLLAQNNLTRGCGDDGLTVYSISSSQEINGATLRNNTSIGMWWANGLRIAGGRNVRAENNLVMDDVKESGIYIGVFGADGNNLDSAVVTGNIVLRCGNSRCPAGMCISASPGNKIVRVTIANNTIKDAQMYGMVIGSNTETINVQPGNIIDHPAQTAIWVQSGAAGSAYFDGNKLINRIGGKLAYKNDAPATFAVTFGKNSGFPDTLSSGAISPLQTGSLRSLNLSISQTSQHIKINFRLPDNTAVARVSLFNSVGRVVWSDQSHGSTIDRESICPTGKFPSGMYVVKVAVTNANGGTLSENSRPIALLRRTD